MKFLPLFLLLLIGCSKIEQEISTKPIYRVGDCVQKVCQSADAWECDIKYTDLQPQRILEIGVESYRTEFWEPDTKQWLPASFDFDVQSYEGRHKIPCPKLGGKR